MQVIERLYDEFINSTGISIDTRTLKKGEMFFALSGENFDGNVFAQTALEGGASCVVVSDPKIVGINVFHVQNCLIALQKLASYHRDKLNIPIIAITGSNGKTTTKELVSLVLASKFETIATKGNLNNHIGVPLSLLSITEQTEIAVIEIGANHIGEVKFLCSLTRPTHGLITNIGKAHLEGFGSLEGVKIAKSELYDSLESSNGVVFVNVNADYLEELAVHIRKKVRYVVDDPVAATVVDYKFSEENSDDGVCIGWCANGTKHLFECPLYGDYNVPNIAAAVTLGLYFGIRADDISAAIRSYSPANNRSQIVQKDGKTIILDAYNANPVSMDLAIKGLAAREETKSLILGGMNELGEYEREEHLKLLDTVSQFDWAEVLLIGSHFEEVMESFQFKWFEDVDSCRQYLEGHKLSGEVVLLKGSRSLKIESLLNYIK